MKIFKKILIILGVFALCFCAFCFLPTGAKTFAESEDEEAAVEATIPGNALLYTNETTKIEIRKADFVITDNDRTIYPYFYTVGEKIYITKKDGVLQDIAIQAVEYNNENTQITPADENIPAYYEIIGEGEIEILINYSASGNNPSSQETIYIKLYDKSKYTIKNQTDYYDEDTMPYIEINENIVTPKILHNGQDVTPTNITEYNTPIKNGVAKFANGSNTRFYLTVVGRYEVKYYDKETGAIIRDEDAITINGPKQMIDTTSESNKCEFLVFTDLTHTSSAKTTEDEESATFAETNRTAVWFDYANTNGDEISGNYYYKGLNNANWSAKQSLPLNHYFSNPGYYYVTISIGSTSYNYAFKIKSYNPQISITTTNKDFDNQDVARQLYDGQYTNSDVTISFTENISPFDIAPSITCNNQTINQNGQTISITASNNTLQKYNVTVKFGHNGKSQVVSSFWIDTTAINLNPQQKNMIGENFTTLSSSTEAIGNASTRPFMLNASKQNRNNAASIDTAQYYFVGLTQTNTEDVSLLTDDGKTYLPTVNYGSYTSSHTWNNYKLGTTQFTQSGLYLFRLMDQAYNKSYYYIYLDGLRPNILYDVREASAADKTAHGSTNPDTDYKIHTITFGDYKAVEINGLNNLDKIETSIGQSKSIFKQIGSKYYLITKINTTTTKIDSKNFTNRQVSTYTTREKTNSILYACENDIYNEGFYTCSVADTFSNQSATKSFRISYDLANTQIFAKTGSDQASDYSGDTFPNIVPANNSQSGTNFNYISIDANTGDVTNFNLINVKYFYEQQFTDAITSDQTTIYDPSASINNLGINNYVNQNTQNLTEQGSYKFAVTIQILRDNPLDVNGKKLYGETTLENQIATLLVGYKISEVNGSYSGITNDTIIYLPYVAENQTNSYSINTNQYTYSQTELKYNNGENDVKIATLQAQNSYKVDTVATSYSLFFDENSFELETKTNGTKSVLKSKTLIFTKDGSNLKCGDDVVGNLNGNTITNISEKYRQFFQENLELTFVGDTVEKTIEIDFTYKDGALFDSRITTRIYNIYVDRTKLLDSTTQFTDQNSKITFADTNFAIANSNTSLNYVNDSFGKISNTNNNYSVESNKYFVNLTIPTNKYTSNLDVFAIESELVLGSETISQIENLYKKGLYNLLLSDNLNSTIILKSEERLKGNAIALSFLTNYDAPYGELKKDTKSAKLYKDIVYQDYRYVEEESTVHPNTYYIKNDGSTYKFVITQPTSDYMLRYDFTKTTLNGAIVGTNTIDGNTQTIAIDAEHEGTYTIVVSYYDEAQTNLNGTNFKTTTYTIIVDNTKPQYNFDKVKEQDEFYQEILEQNLQNSIGTNYFYPISNEFVFEQTDIQDSYRAYYRWVDSALSNSDQLTPTTFDETNISTYRPIEYGVEFRQQINYGGLFEIFEFDASGNQTTYFVFVKENSDQVSRNILVRYKNFYGSQEGIIEQYTTLQSVVATENAIEINTVPSVIDSIFTTNFDIAVLNTPDRYFKINITIGETTQTIYALDKNLDELNSIVLEQINNLYNLNGKQATQIGIEIFDRTSIDIVKSFKIKLNICGLDDNNLDMPGITYEENENGNFDFTIPETNAYYIDILSATNLKTGNDVLTILKNTKTLESGIYYITYKNNFGKEFAFYAANVDTSVDFYGAKYFEKNKTKYYGDDMSFVYSAEIYNLNSIVVNNGANTFSITPDDENWQIYIESFNLSNSSYTIKFNTFEDAKIAYTVHLTSIQTSEETTYSAIYYSKVSTPNITEYLNNASGENVNEMQVVFGSNNTARLLNAKYEGLENGSDLFGEDIAYISAIYTDISNKKGNYNLVKSQINPAYLLVLSNEYIFEIDQKSLYKRIDFTLTVENYFGHKKVYTIIADSDQYPVYSIAKVDALGNVLSELKLSSVTASEVSFGSEVVRNVKQYYTNTENFKIVLAEDKVADVDDEGNFVGDGLQYAVDKTSNAGKYVYKIWCNLPTFRFEEYIVVNIIDPTTTLEGLFESGNSQATIKTANSELDLKYRTMVGGNGLDVYATVELVDTNYVQTNQSGTITLSSAGTYHITYCDIAGNIHYFGQTPYQIVDIVNEVLFSAQASNFSGGELVDSMVFENAVALKVENANLFDENTLRVVSSTYNGNYFYFALSGTQNLTDVGVYEIVLTGKVNRAEVTSRYKIYVINPDEQRFGIDLVFANDKSVIQTISSILRRNATGIFDENEDVTNQFKATYGTSTLSQFLASEYESGNGYYTVTVKQTNVSPYKPTNSYTFHILVNNFIPIITSNINFGSITSKNIKLFYNPAEIYSYYGSVIISIKNENETSQEYLIDENQKNNNYIYEINLTDQGKYTIDILTSSRSMILNRYTIIKKPKLNTLSIVLICVGGVVLLVGVFIFFKLRTKMKVR